VPTFFSLPIEAYDVVQYLACMNAVNYSDLRQNLKARMDKVYHNQEHKIVYEADNDVLKIIACRFYY